MMVTEGIADGGSANASVERAHTTHERERKEEREALISTKTSCY